MLVLIDGDPPVYACGFSAEKNVYSVCEEVFATKKEALNHCLLFDIDYDEVEKEVIAEDVSHALHNAKKLINTVCEATDAEEYKVFLTGKGNFREDLVDYYKANRDSSHKPVHYEALREYFVEKHNAEVVVGMEADDMLAITQYQTYLHTGTWDNTCIATIDKDLDTVAGWHYNWNKKKLYFVTEFEASKFFYTQCLTGDTVDNIKGIHGIGPKKAEKILDGCTTEFELYDAVLSAYEEHHVKEFGVSEAAKEDFTENANLLWMLRHPDEHYQPPTNDYELPTEEE